MATGSDVRDILELAEEGQEFVTKESLFNDGKLKVSILTVSRNKE